MDDGKPVWLVKTLIVLQFVIPTAAHVHGLIFGTYSKFGWMMFSTG